MVIAHDAHDSYVFGPHECKIIESQMSKMQNKCMNVSFIFSMQQLVLTACKTDHLIAPPLVYIATDWMSKAGIATSCSAASASSNGASGIPAGITEMRTICPPCCRSKSPKSNER